jgi:hypothetical protein
MSGILSQGCQMVYFQTENPNLGKFWRALDWKLLLYCKDICDILRTIGIFYDHLVNFVFNLVYFYRFGIMYPKYLATLS